MMRKFRRQLSANGIGFMIVITWLLFLWSPHLEKAWDDLTSKQPWFHQEVIILSNGTVLYYRDINRWMRGEWTTVVQFPRANHLGFRTICDGSGNWTYTVGSSGWLLEPMEFIRYTGGCPMPGIPFRVCTDYIMEDLQGRREAFGPFCTEVYDFK